VSPERFVADLASDRFGALAERYRGRKRFMSNQDPNLAPSFGHVPDFELTERERRGLIEDDTKIPEPDDDKK
jgi:hypothetical protein